MFLSVLPKAERASQDNVARKEEGRTDTRFTPAGPISSDLHVRTHKDHYKVTGTTWKVNSKE